MNDSAFLLDSSFWVALAFTRHPAHDNAERYFASALSPASTAIFCRSTQQSVLRLMTTPSIHRKYGAEGMTNAMALEIMNGWRTTVSVNLLPEPDNTESIWYRLADRKTASPKLWMDAYLAAFAIAGNYTLVTFDKDFEQFTVNGLKLIRLEVPSEESNSAPVS